MSAEHPAGKKDKFDCLPAADTWPLLLQITGGQHAQMGQQSAQLTFLQIKDFKNINFLDFFSLPVKVLQNSTFFNDCILYQVIASL